MRDTWLDRVRDLASPRELRPPFWRFVETEVFCYG